MNNTFVTQTDAKFTRNQQNKSILLVFPVFSLVACLCFFVGWELFLFAQIVIVISCCVTFFKNCKNTHSWKLAFEGDELVITNLVSNESFQVYDIPASDFVINQTKKEQTLDYCSLMIKNTVFAFGGIQNCSALKAYINENYK